MSEKQLSACGIVAEYNPFHNGHAYQLRLARQQSHADVMVVAMSGDFVQRGELALLDKWTRAKQAIDNGADLVVELPFVSAAQPADGFAQGAVSLLAALNCQYLAFGTESVDIDYEQLGKALLHLPAAKAYFVDYTKTYATQINDYLRQTLGISLDQPNLLLAASYAKAVAALNQPMQLLPIQRIGAKHDSDQPHAHFASASWIRQQVLANKVRSTQPFVPEDVFMDLMDSKRLKLSWQAAFPFLKYRITSETLAQLQGIYQMNEGLEYRMKHVMRRCDSFAALLTALKTKRYTYARLQRVLLYTLLNTTAVEMTQPASYVFPLAFNEQGRQFLHQQKKALAIPLIQRADQKNTKEGHELYLQTRVDLFYEQLCGVPQDYGRPPIYRQGRDNC